MAQSHGHPLFLALVIGGGGYLLYRAGVFNSAAGALVPPVNVTPPGTVTPGAAQAAVYDPSVNPAWTVEPSAVIAATEAASGINNPFDALVAAYPRGALVEEYQAWLHRAPDPAGEDYWLNWIAQQKAAGRSPYQYGPDLITAFQTSAEAKALQ